MAHGGAPPTRRLSCFFTTFWQLNVSAAVLVFKSTWGHVITTCTVYIKHIVKQLKSQYLMGLVLYLCVEGKCV